MLVFSTLSFSSLLSKGFSTLSHWVFLSVLQGVPNKNAQAKLCVYKQMKTENHFASEKWMTFLSTFQGPHYNILELLEILLFVKHSNAQ